MSSICSATFWLISAVLGTSLFITEGQGARLQLAGSRLVQAHHHNLPQGWTWEKYHNHDEVTQFLVWMTATYPQLATLQTIGQSVHGRELLTVQLSGRRVAAARVPKVKLVGGIHGNEQACPEVLLRFIHHLVTHYGRCQRITRLLDSTDLHFLPTMNPDGREADTRFNAEGVDLNRNFPLDPLPFGADKLPYSNCLPRGLKQPFRQDAPPGPPSDTDSETVKSWREVGAGPPQPEVQAVMVWSKQHDFVLSASLHQGALVANYPFDSCDTQALLRSCPTLDDPLPLFLADVYAQNHAAMRLNHNDTFVNGTVQGAQWYTLLGGMQDWMYWDRQSLELTLELNPVMKPPVEEVTGHMWQHNLPSLLRFIEMGHLGLHGRLVEAQTSQPLQGWVEVMAPSRHRPVTITGPQVYFFMMLAPDVVYCLLIHVHQPKHSKVNYHTIKAAALRLGGATLIKGAGLEGLTEKVVFMAERDDEHDGEQLSQAIRWWQPWQRRADAQQQDRSRSRRLLPAWQQWMGVVGSASKNLRHRPQDVVLVGDATPDVCWTS